LFFDVLATAAAFVGTTVHPVSLRRTVSNHRCDCRCRGCWNVDRNTL